MFRFDRRLFAHFDWLMTILLLVICGMALFNLYSASYPPKTMGDTTLPEAMLLFSDGVCGHPLYFEF